MLVGREDEIRQLTALIEDTALAAGHLHFVQIDGDIGVGKSALISAVVSRLRERNVLSPSAAQSPGVNDPRSSFVFLAQGAHYEQHVPLAAFRVLCEDLLGSPLDELLATATPPVLATRCVEALSRASLVIAVDDVHRLEPASMSFLETLMQLPTLAPVTVVVVHRAGHAPWNLCTSAQRRGALHDTHTVKALPDQAISKIAEGLPDQQARAVVEVSNGNPLIAHTAVAGFRSHPEAEYVEEVLVSASDSRSDVLASATLGELEQLTHTARRVLEALVVFGDIDLGSIVNVADLDPITVHAGLQELSEQGFVDAHQNGTVPPVVRLSVYHNIDVARRVDLHRRAASLPGMDAFDRAEHLAGALMNGVHFADSALAVTEKEAEVLVQAAGLALGLKPNTSLRWLGSLPQTLRTPRSETLSARALIMTGNFEEAIGRLRMLVADDGSAEAHVLLVNALRMTGQTYEARAFLASSRQWTKGAEATLLREYIDLIALIDGQAPDELVSRLESFPDESKIDVNRSVAAVYRTMTLLSEGRVPQARVTFQRVINWVEQAANDELASVSHATAAAVWAAYILDEYSVGASIASRALSLARRDGQADVLANLGSGLAFCQAALGLLENAEETGEQAVRDAEEYGPPCLVGMARAGLMVAAQGRNDPALLKKRFDELVETPLPEFGWFRRAVLTTRTRISAMLGEPEPCLELIGTHKDAMVAQRYADAAVVAAASGDSTTAKTLLDEGKSIAEEQEQHGQRAMVLTTEAEMLLRSGNPLQAGNLLRVAREIFEERDMRLQLWRVLAGIARAEAALAEQSEPLAQLTRREREIADVIAAGLTNRQIADRLVLSHRTVENHIRNILKKLGAKSRQQIVDIVTRFRSADST